MIIIDEFMASLDQPSQCIVMRRSVISVLNLVMHMSVDKVMHCS